MEMYEQDFVPDFDSEHEEKVEQKMPISLVRIGNKIEEKFDPTPTAHLEDLNDIISKNLQPLLQNTKKSLAQEIYYSTHPQYESPLTKIRKPPVHERLGFRRPKRFIAVPLQKTPNAIMTRRKRLNQNFGPVRGQNTPFFFRNSKLVRIQSNSQPENKKIIRLRRPTRNPKTNNLTIQFTNNNRTEPPKRFQLVLNAEIQNAIAGLKGDTCQVLHPKTKCSPEVSSMYINDRFSQLY